jgi:hypothetical protein
MKRFFLATLLFCLIVSYADAQIWKLKRYEAVVGIGPSFFFGDIGGYSQTKNILGLKDLTIHQVRYNFDANFKYRITQTFNVRLSLATGSLHATDVRGSNENRNFEASTLFIEPALLGEFYFIKNKAENSYLFTKGKSGLIGLIKSLDFYVFTGIGGIGYSVRGNSKFESAGVTQGSFAAVIPVGIGGTLIYSPNFNFGFEIGGRYSFSDYLDGYSPPQYSLSNDVYYFFNFTITYKLKSGANGLPSFR